MPPSSVLLVSRQATLAETVRSICKLFAPLRLEVCDSAASACEWLRRLDVELVLVHVSAAADASSFDGLLRAAAARFCPTVFLAEQYCDAQARALLRTGASAYLALPADATNLPRLVDAFSQRRPAAPAVAPDQETEWPDLIGPLRRVAPQDIDLLLTGEFGTGKSRLARLVHDLSPRCDQPFVTVDCGALSPSWVEAELFGHSGDAWGGADCTRAGKLVTVGRGTLLLEQVNALALSLQVRLLRVLDEGFIEATGVAPARPFRARLIAASDTPLGREVAKGRFRRDLYYRLNSVCFDLPPLREQRGRIAALAERLLKQYASRNRPDVTGISAEGLRVLQGYDWPGNVRELRYVLERAVALCPHQEVAADDLPERIRSVGTSEPRDRRLHPGALS
jgi:DNA-binding NtrC family response regulator